MTQRGNCICKCSVGDFFWIQRSVETHVFPCSRWPWGQGKTRKAWFTVLHNDSVSCKNLVFLLNFVFVIHVYLLNKFLFMTGVLYYSNWESSDPMSFCQNNTLMLNMAHCAILSTAAPWPHNWLNPMKDSFSEYKAGIFTWLLPERWASL